jgi:hypothetical protein
MTMSTPINSTSQAMLTLISNIRVNMNSSLNIIFIIVVILF